MSSPALVLLAAGDSERLGQPKALVRLRASAPGSPLELLLSAGAALGDPRPLVIVGPAAAAIEAVLPEGVEVLVNHEWRAGRTGSVRVAVEARPGRALCLAPVDVPLVPDGVFARLAEEWRRLGAPAHGWLAPFVLHGGTRRHGHPVVVGHALASELKGFPPDRPLHELRARARPLAAVQVTSAAILDDLDTPADLERLTRRLTP
jgi:CTP:molybdopterin cytidylyltransferase MocA